MKIASKDLTQIIREELQDFLLGIHEQQLGRTTASQVRHGAAVKSDLEALTAPGVSDEERNLIANLRKQLAIAAKGDNIGSGNILQMSGRLSALLSKSIQAKQSKKQ